MRYTLGKVRLRWISNPESIEAGKPTVLAIVETILTMAVSIGLAVWWGSYLHIAVSATLAPLLLMDTDVSRIYVARIRKRIINWLEPIARALDDAPLAIKVALWPLFLFVFIPVITALPRFVGTAVAIVWHPLSSVAAVPGNWRESALLFDSAKSPQISARPRGEVPPDLSADDFGWADLREVWRDAMDDEFLSPARDRVLLVWWVPMFLLIALPALLYRWSLKSTAIIWFPILWALPSNGAAPPPVVKTQQWSLRVFLMLLFPLQWAVSSVRGARAPLREYFRAYLLDPINILALVVSFVAITGSFLKLVLMQNTAAFTAWWNGGPVRKVLSLYVAPQEIQWWHVAIFVNSLLAIGMFVFAWRWLVWSKPAETLSRRIFQGGLFIRPILSCYTIGCTLYMTVVAATSWNWPPLGTKLFPWM